MDIEKKPLMDKKKNLMISLTTKAKRPKIRTILAYRRRKIPIKNRRKHFTKYFRDVKFTEGESAEVLLNSFIKASGRFKDAISRSFLDKMVKNIFKTQNRPIEIL